MKAERTSARDDRMVDRHEENSATGRKSDLAEKREKCHAKKITAVTILSVSDTA